MCWGRKQTDLFLSGVGHSWVSWHFTRAVDTLVPILETGKLRQQLLSDLSKLFQLLDQSNQVFQLLDQLLHQSNHFFLFKACGY